MDELPRKGTKDDTREKETCKWRKENGTHEIKQNKEK